MIFVPYASLWGWLGKISGLVLVNGWATNGTLLLGASGLESLPMPCLVFLVSLPLMSVMTICIANTWAQARCCLEAACTSTAIIAWMVHQKKMCLFSGIS